VPIRYDPGGSTTVVARSPRRANAKELRRAYDRARQELKTIELEALPKNDRKQKSGQSQIRRENGARPPGAPE
jgi:hypothetical protein